MPRLAALLPLLAALAPAAAQAKCPNQSGIFSCQIGRKTLEVCHWKGMITYEFGLPNKAELSLFTPETEADFTPWSGVGRTMWSSLAFHNEGITYEVWSSLDKLMNDDDPMPEWQGGVNVLQGDKTLAQLTCNPGSVEGILDTVYDIKTDLGQCWNLTTFAWQQAPCP